MGDWLWVLVILALVLILGVTVAIRYNALVQARVRTQEAWSGINVQLQRRADLVPPLVETVRGYAGHENRVFEEVAQARGSVQQAGNPAEATAANVLLVQSLGHLFGLVEAYPDLKASANFAALMAELSDIEEKIAFARQFYNINVLNLNTRLQTLPDVLYASQLGFMTAAFFDAEEAAQSVPRVGFGATPAAPQPPVSPHA